MKTKCFDIVCVVVPVLLLLFSGCSAENCGSKTCPTHGHLNRPEPPEYRFKQGEFVEHFAAGKAVISRLEPPGIDTNWPIYTIRAKSGVKRSVWEHELKPLKIEGYKSPVEAAEAPETEIDLDTQMMEERIEKRVLERMEGHESIHKLKEKEVGDTGVEPVASAM